MRGIHDLGGMAGFGTIEVEANEPTFHEPWQSLAFRLNTAAIGWLKAYNADEYRHAVERLDPAYYLSATYYERMLTATATLLVEKGVLSQPALETLAGGSIPLANPAVDPAPDRATSVDVASAEDEPVQPFELGQRVRVRYQHTSGHTRAPHYVQGHVGTVLHIAPPFSYPDHSAHGLPERVEPTLHVSFSSRELWGDFAEADDQVIVDLWQSYLEPAV